MGATSAARCSGCQQRPASPWRAARSLGAAGRTCVSEGSRVSTTGGNSKSRGRIGSAQRRGSRSACSSLPQHCGRPTSAFSFGRTRRRNGGSRAARLCVADGGCRRVGGYIEGLLREGLRGEAQQLLSRGQTKPFVEIALDTPPVMRKKEEDTKGVQRETACPRLRPPLGRYSRFRSSTRCSLTASSSQSEQPWVSQSEKEQAAAAASLAPARLRQWRQPRSSGAS